MPLAFKVVIVEEGREKDGTGTHLSCCTKVLQVLTFAIFAGFFPPSTSQKIFSKKKIPAQISSAKIYFTGEISNITSRILILLLVFLKKRLGKFFQKLND